MLRKLLIIGCLFCTHLAFAQKTVPNAKPPFQKAESVDVPEQAIGAPLPPFILIKMPKPVAEKTHSKQKKHTSEGTETPALAPPKLITNKDVKYDANLFMMFFNPTCGHCEDMTELLEKHIQLFNKTKIVMVASPNARPYMPEFEKGYNTDQYSTLIVGTDSLNLIGKLFLYHSLPQINIYDKNRKLLKVFSGDTPLDSLKPYIQ